MEKVNSLDEVDKEIIVSYTLDSLGYGLIRGMILGSFFYWLTKRKIAFLICAGYSTGVGYENASRFYNDYVKNKIIR